MRSFVTVSAFIAALLLNTHVKAQKTDPKFFAGVSFGASFPTGKFAGKNQQDTIAGLAKPGPSLSISLGYMFTPKIGVAVLFGGQENGQDAGSFGNTLRQEYGDSVLYKVTTHYWKTGRILAGPVFKIPMTKDKKLVFESKILAGILKTSTPAYSYAYGFSNLYPGYPFYTNSVTFGSIPMNTAFCYQLNAGLEYRITKMISLVSDLSYFRAAPLYKFAHYYYNFNLTNGTFSDRGPYQRKFDVSTVNAMVGAEIRF
jgi:hypothetical protein